MMLPFHIGERYRCHLIKYNYPMICVYNESGFFQEEGIDGKLRPIQFTQHEFATIECMPPQTGKRKHFVLWSPHRKAYFTLKNFTGSTVISIDHFFTPDRSDAYETLDVPPVRLNFHSAWDDVLLSAWDECCIKTWEE